MTDPSLVAQTITISHNVAIVAVSCFASAGFLIGYAIAWRQRRDERNDTVLAPDPLFVGGIADVAPFVCDCQLPPGKHPHFAAVSCGCPIHGDAADIRRGWA
ncbi:hypothetical protein ACSHT2_02635 [Bradyrhizobium sp. PUT101]|uniref:hypothetical protein n=1 Tax=Bradyrhizobium sp. PUT101 TaxID=3447427 RepID=UPI003F845955